eukprot:XP_002942569.2 PREDICTED: olfactory receptor 2M3-like [Xenopus tropicalis]
MNATSQSNNTTLGSGAGNKTAETVRMAFLCLIVVCFLLFLCLVTVILYVFFTNAQVRESARHVLFTHMLVNDSLYLAAGLCLLVASLYVVSMPVPLCYIVITVVTSTFWVTPYNLAVMSLERYVAICHPLRHAEICSGHRSGAALGAIWALGLTPNIADIIALSRSADKAFYSLRVICTKEILILNITQKSIRSYSLIISLSLVASAIIYTYIKVMLVARKVGSGRSSAIKAGKTVLLHGVQLLLSLMSLISLYTEISLGEYVVLLAISNFLFFTCLPRFLSPLIYGLRDEVLSRYLKRLYPKAPLPNVKKTCPSEMYS